MISLVVADDQTLVRRGICGLLALTGDLHVAAEAAGGEEALQAIAAHRPDVVLLDIRMPGMSGIEVLRALRHREHCPPVILLTTFDDDHAVLEGVKAGARGYLLKDISLERLADAIRRVAAGESLISPAVTERVMRALGVAGTAFDAPGMMEPLTAREKEILRLMAAGMSNREIADTLGPSEGTVKNHVSNILSKLGVRDRVRAVLRAIELGEV